MEMVSVIIPCYNEEKTVSKVISDVRLTMQASKYKYEIIVVDDGSIDSTAEILRSRKEIVIIKNPIRKGSGNARKQGILKAQGEIILMLDGDGTYPANAIPELLQYISQYDQVIGARRQEFGEYKHLRIIAKWIAKELASCLTGAKIEDLNSGMRVFKKEKIFKNLNLIPDGFSCTTTITMIFLCCGCSIKYIPIEYYKRNSKSHFRPLRDTLNCFRAIFRTHKYFKSRGSL